MQNIEIKKQFLGIRGMDAKKLVKVVRIALYIKWIKDMVEIWQKYFLEAPVKHRKVFCSLLIGPITLGKYLNTGLIKCVNVGGEMVPTKMQDQ